MELLVPAVGSQASPALAGGAGLLPNSQGASFPRAGRRTNPLVHRSQETLSTLAPKKQAIRGLKYQTDPKSIRSSLNLRTGRSEFV